MTLKKKTLIFKNNNLLTFHLNNFRLNQSKNKQIGIGLRTKMLHYGLCTRAE